MRSPTLELGVTEGDLHISRIERRRGPVGRYGESARAVLNLEGYVRSPTLELGVTEGDLT